MAPVDVLAIGAHPDDVELGCGATLAKLVAAGRRVGILHLTRGGIMDQRAILRRAKPVDEGGDKVVVHGVLRVDSEAHRVWVAGEGLTSSAKGKRLTYAGTDRTVTDGPFSEAKELIGGLAIWEVESMDEAIEWARRMPNPSPNGGEVEIRPVLGPGDFGL